MGYRLPNLNWLRAFECAARLRSFTAASEELHLTQAAVSHQIRSLETTLGVQLFIRRSRTLDLTDMGKAYLPSVRGAIEELAFSTQGLFGPPTRNTVTVRAPISLGVLWLAPRLKRFRAQFPGIDVRIVSEIWADSISDRDVDVEIRLGLGAWAGYRAEKLADESIVPVCAPGIARAIRSVADLKAHEMLHILGFEDHWAKYFVSAGLDYDPDQIGVSVDTSLAAVEIVAANGGIALIMKRFAVDLARAGRVAIPISFEIKLDQAHHLLTRASQARSSADVGRFKIWLSSLYE